MRWFNVVGVVIGVVNFGAAAGAAVAGDWVFVVLLAMAGSVVTAVSLAVNPGGES